MEVMVFENKKRGDQPMPIPLYIKYEEDCKLIATANALIVKKAET